MKVIWGWKKVGWNRLMEIAITIEWLLVGPPNKSDVGGEVLVMTLGVEKLSFWVTLCVVICGEFLLFVLWPLGVFWK